MRPPDLVRHLLRHPAWPELKALVIARTGLAYYQDKDADLAQRMASRLARHPGLDPDGYLRLLRAGGAEEEALTAAVTVGETYFFRYAEQFDALARIVVPELAAREGGSRHAAVWSAGCSNGAEAYSASMALRRHPLLRGWTIEVVGTDIDREALAEAEAGFYGAWSLRSMPDELLAECFDRAGNRWRVKDVYRQGVSFRPHNLVEGPPPAAAAGRPFDLVLCRNVVMYFDQHNRRRALECVRAALADGGWLLVGHAEAGADVAELFGPMAVLGAALYRKGPDRPPQKPAAAERPAAPPQPPRHGIRRAPPAVHAATDAAPAPAHAAPVPGQPARQLLDQGRWVEAVAACRAQVAAHPLDPEAHCDLGLALEHASPAEAVAAFRRAVYLDPGFALAHFHLARLRRAEGHRAEADRHLRSVLAALAGHRGDDPIPGGGGLTAAELSALAARVLGREAGR